MRLSWQDLSGCSQIGLPSRATKHLRCLLDCRRGCVACDPRVPARMIAPPEETRIWIAAGITDMRRSVIGLSAQVQTGLYSRHLRRSGDDTQGYSRANPPGSLVDSGCSGTPAGIAEDIQLGPRELYANIDNPKSAHTIPHHPNRPQHNPLCTRYFR